MPDAKTDHADVPVRELLAKFEEARRARLPYERNWERNWRYYRGDHWDGIARRKWWESRPVINKVAEYEEIMRSLLADQRWGLDALPRSIGRGGDERDGSTIAEKASQVNHLLDFLWDDCSVQAHLAEMFLNVFNTGTGLLKATFDPDNVSARGSGQIEVVPVDPQAIFPDPDAYSVGSASYIFERRTVSADYVIRRWPDKVDREKLTGDAYYDPAWGKRIGPNGETKHYDGASLDLLECWYFDETIEEVPDSEKFDADLGKFVYDVRAKYPNGRYTLMLGDGTVLDDKPNPYSRFPYARFVEIPMPGEFWGGCTLDKLIGIQNTINVLTQQIIDNGAFLATGVWVVDDRSGIDPKKLPRAGAPGGVVVKKQGTEAHRDTGDQLPQHLFETLRMHIDMFDRVAGLPDVLRGIVPGRQPVQTTLMQQESGELRTRERARRVEDGLAELGYLFVDIVREYWTDERSFRRVRSNGSLDVFSLSKDDLDGWEFDIIVKPGSTLPLDRMFATQKALEMRGQGIQIPDSYILQLSGLPGIEEVIADLAAEQMPIHGEEGGGADEYLPYVSDGIEGMPPDMPPEFAGMMSDPNAVPQGGGVGISGEELPLL